MASMPTSTNNDNDKDKHEKKARFIIGPADDDILRAVYRYHFLTIDQLTRLLYSKGARTTASTRLKRLADAEYLTRSVIPTRQGNGPAVYSLARKGMQFLADLGFAIPKRARASEERAYSYLFFAHTLAVGDLLIAAELLAAAHPDAIVIEQFRHERDLKRQPVYIEDGAEGKLAVIPDGYLSLVLAGQYRMCFAFELDRGTEDQQAWRRKVRALLRYVQGPYQAAFGTDNLTVCVVATPGKARMQQLVAWTAAELDALGKRQEADLFRFAAPVPDLTPEQLFLGAGWYVPDDPGPVALIDRSYLAGAPEGASNAPHGAAMP